MSRACAARVALVVVNMGLVGATCLKKGMDVGGGFNSCGYAPISKVFAGPGQAAPSWVTSQGQQFANVARAADLDSADDCQAICQGVAGASFFAYEPGKLCICKGEHSGMHCGPRYGPHENADMVSGPIVCEECFKGPGVDMGGGFNSCGYAPIVKVFAGPSYTFGGWVVSQGQHRQNVATEEDLDSSADCQELCKNAGSAYFTFEPGQLCICKNPYTGSNAASCLPLFAVNANNAALVAGTTECSSCYQHEMDMGGSGVKDCGYASEVKVFAGPGFTFPSWVASKSIPSENVPTAADLDSPADCQKHCLKSGAPYFAYEVGQMCVCKNSYGNTSCTPIYHSKANTTSGPTRCEECIMEEYDVAGGANGCGYGKEVVLYGGPLFDINQHSWVVSKNIPVQMANVTGPLHCRDLCAGNQKVSFFVFDASKTRCICKASYAHPMCSPQFQQDQGSVSGPTKCFEKMTTCGDLKTYYKGQSCCGMPSKRVAEMSA